MLLFGKLLSSVRMLHSREWNFQVLQRKNTIFAELVTKRDIRCNNYFIYTKSVIYQI